MFLDKYLSKLTKTVPSYYMVDDHEFGNNVDIATVKDNGLFDAAMQAWSSYAFDARVMTAEQRKWTPGLGTEGFKLPAAFHYSFDYGDSSFFLMDTAGHRDEAPMPLGKVQSDALYKWLDDS